MRHGVRASDVEVELKLTVTLCQEIVAHTATMSVGRSKVFFVGHTGIESVVMTRRKLDIAKLCQDDEAALLARIVAILSDDTVRTFCCCRSSHFVQSGFYAFFSLVEVESVEGAVGIFSIGIAFSIFIIV